MSKKKAFPTHPSHPERICWGCDRYCSVKELACGNGADRTQHPVELFGDDWMDWELKTDDSSDQDLEPVNDPSTKKEQ